MPRHSFELHIHPEDIFRRFSSSAAWTEFQSQGTINIPGIFDYITADEDVMALVNLEFELYDWHYFTEGGGQNQRGWLRNMVYSLIQQLVRMDPVYYALNVAARPDLNWRLISVPYYTKSAAPGDSTGFQHLDMNVHRFYHAGEGPINMIQGSLSLDNEDQDGCTMVVKGFHKNIRNWWSDVIARGSKGSHTCGNTDTRDIYTKADQEKYGALTPVPCVAGGIRLTRAEIIHGSTPQATKGRRAIYPWFTGVGEDHDAVDIFGAEAWGKLAEYHRDMKPPQKQASGRSASSYGERAECLIPKVALDSTSAIGAALLGRTKWTGAVLMKELSSLFGEDDKAAREYVDSTRARAVAEFKNKFRLLEGLEREMFGDASFFLNKDTNVEAPAADGLAIDELDLEDFEVEMPDSDSESD